MPWARSCTTSGLSLVKMVMQKAHKEMLFRNASCRMQAMPCRCRAAVSSLRLLTGNRRDQAACVTHMRDLYGITFGSCRCSSSGDIRSNQVCTSDACGPLCCTATCQVAAQHTDTLTSIQSKNLSWSTRLVQSPKHHVCLSKLYFLLLSGNCVISRDSSFHRTALADGSCCTPAVSALMR